MAQRTFRNGEKQNPHKAVMRTKYQELAAVNTMAELKVWLRKWL